MRGAEQMKPWLETADKIIYVEPDGDVVLLAYDKGYLCKATWQHHSGIAVKPLADVDHIYYNYEHAAWQVFWKEDNVPS